MSFHIWVDADAAPVPAKEILFRAARRTGNPMTLVANQPMRIPDSENIDFLLVGQGFDVADSEIVRRMNPGDLVVTADIPLASDVIDKGGHALNPRGEMYEPGTIKEKLAMRDLMSTLRDAGLAGGGPGSYGPRDKKAFASKLDGFLMQVAKNGVRDSRLD
jgi:uncharacterized protein